MSVSTYIQVPIHTRVPKHEPEVSLCCAPQGGRPVREKDRQTGVVQCCSSRDMRATTHSPPHGAAKRRDRWSRGVGGRLGEGKWRGGIRGGGRSGGIKNIANETRGMR